MLYLVAIVSANLVTSRFGVGASYFNAFMFIGLDLTLRDKLHDGFGKHKLFKMGLLVLTGSIISYLLEAPFVALASGVAFLLSGLADTVVYHLTEKFPRFVRVNGSNSVGAVVDSLVFPTIAFGGFSPEITLIQFLCKFLGGFFWYYVIKFMKR